MSTMPDETNEFEDRATLTQRRQMSGAAKLSRSKLEPISSGVDDVKEGSTGKIIVWVVAIITIAAAAYFGIKSYLSKPTDNNPTVTPTVSVEPTQTITEKVVNSTTLADSEAKSVQPNAAYTSSAQTVGKASTDAYTLDAVSVQKYTSFTRFIFEVNADTSDGQTVANPFPVVSTAYDATKKAITVTFTQIDANTSEFISSDEIVDINTANILNLTYDKNVPTEQEKYVIQLNTAAGYVLQALPDSHTIVVDVKDPKVVATTPVAATTATTPSVTNTVTPTASVTATITATPAVVSTSSTTFSQGSQQITSSLTTNTFSLADGYVARDNMKSTVTGETYSGMFTFEKGLPKDTIPNVSATLDSENKLTINISNYTTTTRAMQSYNMNGQTLTVTGFTAEIKNHVLTYVFTLNKARDYRIVFDTDKDVLHIQVKN